MLERWDSVNGRGRNRVDERGMFVSLTVAVMALLCTLCDPE